MTDEDAPTRGVPAPMTPGRHPAPESVQTAAVEGWTVTDRCGYEWDPEWLNDQSKNQHCCARHAWPESEAGRCWWHMERRKSLTDFLTEAETERYRTYRKRRRGDGDTTAGGESEVETDGAPLSALLDAGDVQRELLGNRRYNATDVSNPGDDRHSSSDPDAGRVATPTVAPTTADGVRVSGHPAELLCGAVLEAVRLEDTFAFTNCWINGATLSRANLQGAAMAGVDLERVTALDVVLRDATLAGGDLRGDFDGAHMHGVDLTDADVSEVGYEYAALPRPSLRAATLTDATLTATNLGRADLTDADLADADLRRSNLERAALTRANLFGADLSNARLYGTVLGEAQMNDATTLLSGTFVSLRGDRAVCAYDPANPHAPRDDPGDSGRGAGETAATDGTDGPVDRWTKAAGTYRKLETLAAENSFPGVQRSMFVRRKDAQRRKHRETEGRLAPNHVGAAVSWVVFRYGEGYARVLSWCAMLVVGFALLFPLGGWIRPVGDGATLGTRVTWGRIVREPTLFWDSIYYSTLTFTNLGFGDFRPAGSVGQALTVAETGVGVVMLSLLVFVLGRRAAR